MKKLFASYQFWRFMFWVNVLFVLHTLFSGGSMLLSTINIIGAVLCVINYNNTLK